MFEFFGWKERKILGGAFILLLAFLLFHYFVALGEKRAYVQSQELLENQKKELDQIRKENARLERDWKQWNQARQNMKELKEAYLYTREGGIETLRKDLQRIFRRYSVDISPLRYDYPGSNEDNFRRIQVSFDATGSYFSLKKFIHHIEKFPKFLVLEKIDFIDIQPESGVLKLKVVVSGYYET